MQGVGAKEVRVIEDEGAGFAGGKGGEKMLASFVGVRPVKRKCGRRLASRYYCAAVLSHNDMR